MANWIVGGLLLLAVALSIGKVRRDRKQGKGCCGNCAYCSGCAKAMKKEKG